MHVYNKAIYICPKPQSECICFDQSLKWDLSVGHKNNVCLKENSSGFRSLQWGCSVHCGIAVCNAAKVLWAFPYNPLHPEAYSLPVKCLSNLHLACKTLIYLLAFYFFTKLFFHKPQTHVFLHKLYFIINIHCDICKKQDELSQNALKQGQEKLFYLENICPKIKPVNVWCTKKVPVVY